MVHLILEGEGLSIKEEISRLQALQILAFVDSSSNAGFSPASAPTVLSPAKIIPQALAGKRESAGEYLRDSGAKTNPEKILALAHFSMMMNSEEEFDPSDVQRLFERARENPPKNFSRDFKNVLGNWIEESSTEKGKYWITKTGMQILEEKFVGAAPISTNHPSGSIPKRQTASAPVLPPEVIEKMHSGYWSGQLQTAVDKILFILMEGQKYGKSELQSGEINGIAQQLADKPFTNVATLLALHKNKWMKQNGGYKILKPGIDYIEERLAVTA